MTPDSGEVVVIVPKTVEVEVIRPESCGTVPDVRFPTTVEVELIVPLR
jgi:hypothetical protein